MAKQSSKSKSSSAATHGNGGEAKRGEFTSAVRDALTELGLDAKTGPLRAHIRERHPQFADKLEGATFSNTLSVQRRRMREDGGMSARMRKPGSEALTAEDLLKARQLVGEGDPEAFLAEVRRWEELVNRAGGFARLRRCLEVLAKLRE